jgi:antitoxin ChpS
MHTTNLRKVGGSVMLAIPPAILEQLHLKAGDKVALALNGEYLSIYRPRKPRYKLEELLTKGDSSEPMTAKEREWLDAPPVGREHL